MSSVLEIPVLGTLYKNIHIDKTSKGVNYKTDYNHCITNMTLNVNVHIELSEVKENCASTYKRI
jgi:hypothetical protein